MRIGMATRTKIALRTDECCAPLRAAPLDEANADDLAVAFAALADPVRLRLISLLATADGGEVCACDLVEPVGRSQPTVSHHLKVLTDAGLIQGTRQGRWIRYSVIPARLAELKAILS